MTRGPFRVAIMGRSMEPTLRDGDWLVVVPPRRLPRVGDLVVAIDPLHPPELLVKRVAGADGETLRLASESDEHRGHFAERSVGVDDVVGVPFFRYAPLSRVGLVR